jgi:hypothetical protein
METYVWILIGLQVIVFWQLVRLRKVVKLNNEMVRITPMLLEIVALQAQLNNIQNDLQNVQNIEAEFKRIIGNL